MGEADSFSIAKKLSEQLPAPSAMFSSCIRAIRAAEQTLGPGHESELKDLAVSSTSFVVSVSPTLKAVYFAAAEDLHADRLAKLSPLTHRSLLGLFTASEVTTILAVTYLYRHIKRRLGAEEAQNITKKMLPHMEIAAAVGETINHIGLGNGMLIGAMRYLSLAFFALADIKGYNEMRRKLEKKNLLFDLAEEERRWGCNHLEIASAILTQFGFGIIPSMGMGVNLKSEDTDKMDPLTSEKLLCWRVALSLTATFHETGQAPQVGEDSELYLPEEEAASLKKRIWSILRDGSSYDWVLKGKQDVPDEARAALDISLDKAAGGASASDESLTEMEDSTS